MSSLDGKVALVTGAGRGIGRAIAISLAKSRCHVILTARTVAELADVQQELRNLGDNAVAIVADLTKDGDLRELVEQCGPVDFLINNAGWGKRDPVIRAKIADWDQTLRLNLRAPMILAQKLLPAMIEKGSWAVIKIGRAHV